MHRRLLPDRYGGPDRAAFDLVAPLAHEATAMHETEIAGHPAVPGRSGAVSPLIGASLRRGDIDSANLRSTPRTPTMPGCRTSTTATRTTTTRTMSGARVLSADQTGACAGQADFSFEDLVVAYFDCRRTKRNKPSALAFEQDLERNLLRLDEDQATADERIPLLLQTPAAVRWISAEPLLGQIYLNDLTVQLPDGVVQWDALLCDDDPGDCAPYGTATIDWVVCGGESGPKARPMHPDWVRSIRDQCQEAGVPFFFKQWGEWAPHTTAIEGPDGSVKTTPRSGITWRAHKPGAVSGMFRVGKKVAGRTLDGRTWDGYPI